MFFSAKDATRAGSFRGVCRLSEVSVRAISCDRKSLGFMDVAGIAACPTRFGTGTAAQLPSELRASETPLPSYYFGVLRMRILLFRGTILGSPISASA